MRIAAIALVAIYFELVLKIDSLATIPSIGIALALGMGLAIVQDVKEIIKK